MQYRRLTAHLQTQNADFDRRLAAYLTNHVAMRSALGQAVSDAWQNNGYQQQPQPSQFMNPGMMQMQQPGFQNPMLPPQMMKGSPTSYRQSPYPMPNANGMRPNAHNRSVSVATPQNMTGFQYQQPMSGQTNPVDTMKPDDRRMSLPPQNMMPATPSSQHGAPQSNHVSPVISRNSSSTNLANTHSYFRQHSPQQQPTPPSQSQSQHMRSQTFPSPFNASSGFNPEFSNMNSFNPMSATLPMETQQLLAGSQAFDGSDPFATMMMQNQASSKSSQPFYSYNPNGKPKSGGPSPSSQDGMNSTLAPSMIDTSVGYVQTPESATIDSAVTPFTPAGYGFGYDSWGGFDMLKDPSSVATSGQVTPAEGDWQGFLNNNVWDDQAVA